jgi:DNA-binding response OmpR family regulator
MPMVEARANERQARREGVPHILIVEDDPPMARCLAGIVKTFGTVTVERTVSGAVAHLSFINRPLGAAIVDLGLPDGSGLTVVSRIRAADANVAILILTGQGDQRQLLLPTDDNYFCRSAPS